MNYLLGKVMFSIVIELLYLNLIISNRQLISVNCLAIQPNVTSQRHHHHHHQHHNRSSRTSHKKRALHDIEKCQASLLDKYDTEQLDAWLLANYTSYLRSINATHMIETNHYVPSIKYKLRETISILERSADEMPREAYGPRACSLDDQEVWFHETKLICPHYFQVLERRDRYPFRVARAFTDCHEGVRAVRDCLDALDVKKSCFPLKVLKPVFQLDATANNNECKWKFSLELIEIAYSLRIFVKMDLMPQN